MYTFFDMAKDSQVKFKVILHKIKTLKDGSHPIVLRITHLQKRKYYSTGEKATEAEWEKIMDLNSRGKYKKIRDLIIMTEDQAEEVIKELKKKDAFTFDAFENSFFTERNNTTVFCFFNQLIQRYIEQNRIGNADVYRQTLNELKRFRKNKDLSFDDITLSFLNSWETYLAPNNSTNSISIYMRTLRSAYNKAVKEKIASRAHYPFKDYQIKKEATVKRALRKEHIQRIAEFDAEPWSRQWIAQQYFIFSYLCQGMPYSDMAYLKWENIIDGRIVYKRIKTIRTSKNPKTISIKITPRTNEILQAFRRPAAQYDDYVFPILRKDMQPVTIKNTIKAKRKRFNHNLREICAAVGIEGNITSYVARHSYATVLKRNGVSTSIISESLGHQTEHMTQTYLDSFDNEVIDAANEGLL